MPANIRNSMICAIAGAALWAALAAPKAYAIAESTGPDGSNVRAVQALGQTGEGVNVGLVSARNTRTTHEAFKDPNGVSHAFSYDFTGDGIEFSGHDTRMAGEVISRGDYTHPDYIGVAPGADIHSARIADNSNQTTNAFLTDALDELVIGQNCRVIVTGVQSDDNADGNSVWTKIYDYYAYQYDVVFATASGNYASQVTIFGDAYNGITTGGLRVTDPDVYLRVGSGTNSGPTVDGRRKPDIVAPAQNQTLPSSESDTAWRTVGSDAGQTSYAVPHTAGVAALLLGAADQTSDPDDNRSEAIKAVIVNSTFPNINDKNNNPTYPAEPNNIWHGDRGYGRIDALRAYELLNADKVAEGGDITQQKGWAYDTMTSYGQHSYSVQAERNDRLVLTVTWHREITKNGPMFTEESAPKFNLDVTVKDPCDTVIFAETATLDNLEKVDVLLEKTGMYEITLDNTTAKSRGYALAFELVEPLVYDFEPIDYIVDTGDLLVISDQWLLQGEALEADLTGDEKVDFEDFAEFTLYWLNVNPAYYNE
ncbi:MAG TPA: S8 family serine peptidase [Planctomycetes bacterium]|nr:S8 family serine peptidase [Planctomycetota bacterium]HIJ71452.1 S8 family serine peptidase [Planctomycetota bacterium]